MYTVHCTVQCTVHACPRSVYTVLYSVHAYPGTVYTVLFIYVVDLGALYVLELELCTCLHGDARIDNRSPPLPRALHGDHVLNGYQVQLSPPTRPSSRENILKQV